MNKSTIGSSLAHANEIMHALLLGQFPSWYKTRADAGGCGFEDEYSERDNAPALKIVKRRLGALRHSLLGARILEVQNNFLKDLEHDQPELDTLRFRFTLGTEKETVAVIDIFFEQGRSNKSSKWGDWELRDGRAIYCAKHSNTALNQKILFGMDIQ